MIKLIEILKELGLSRHYEKRKIDRVDNITDIYIPKEALGDFKLSEVKESIIKNIQNEVYDRLKRLEPENIPSSMTFRIGYKILAPVIQTPNKIYPITLITSKGTGNYYYAIIKDNVLVTLIVSSNEDFEEDIKKHSERKQIDEPIKIIEPPGIIYSINLNQLMNKQEKEKTSQEVIPYKIRTDYRVGASFEHDKYGTGTIVSTSSGNRGIADQRGMLDWVDVDFKKPYLSGGKLQTIRRIPSVYTKIYFDYPLE